MEPDPPTDGLLVLNLLLNNFAEGPGAGADRISLTLDEFDVDFRALVNGQLQQIEYGREIAVGPVPIYIFRPEGTQPQFAGQYWLPPGEVEGVHVHVSEAVATFGETEKPIRFGTTLEGSQTIGILNFTFTGAKPEIAAGERTGVLAAIEVGASATLSEPTTGTLLLDPAHQGHLMPAPVGFGFDQDELIVKYASGTTETQMDTFEGQTGADLQFAHWSGLRFLHFTGTDWAGITAKLMIYRASSLVDFAALNPVLHTTTHDSGLLDDPGFAGDANAAYLDDIGVETTWSTTLGSRQVIVGIVDSGLDINHPDLVDNLWVNVGGLPDINGEPFIVTFDLDGDGVFTLHDLNHPDNPSQLADALDELYDLNGITLRPDLFEIGEDDADLYQGGDLMAAFANDSDDDSNGVVDDLFGANFTETVSDPDCGNSGDATGDVDPDENVGLDKFSTHGTHVAGLIGAEQDNGRNSAGIMGGVRIIEARLDENCGGFAFEGAGGLGEFLKAVDYLVEEGASIIVIEEGMPVSDVSDDSSYSDAEAVALTEIFESYPDVLSSRRPATRMKTATTPASTAGPPRTARSITCR